MEMRIVGLNTSDICIQKRIRREWKQETITYAQFDSLMQMEFPEYYREYRESKTDKPAARWFWNYGETEEMKQKGEAFIFRTNA